MSTTFEGLGLASPILKALTTEGYTTPTPIQMQAIPHVMQGRDVQGIAQTGTGKTAAFALPILHRLLADKRPAKPRSCRVLVLSPTRELASQIVESFRSYGRNAGLRTALMLDHMHDRAVELGSVEVLVLDEADHMLDLGFIVPIRKIVSTIPSARQTLFFSATMPKEISALAGAMLKDPVHVAVTPVATTAERVEQRVIFVETARKRQVLADILKRGDMGRTLVFTRTKHGADRVTQHLEAIGVPAAAIHGNKSQPQRERALAQFKEGRVKVLVATDIAARGIDVDGVTHVVNFDLPNVPEAYVHRIGRTARAGHTGIAISFCDSSERAFLRGIEKLTRTRLSVEEPDRLAA
jgi:ATP-dependent RNA helicase RhlE